MASTMSPLQDRQKRISTHSTTSLVILSLIVLVLGLVTGVGVTSWYNHACSEVRDSQIFFLIFRYWISRHNFAFVAQPRYLCEAVNVYLFKENLSPIRYHIGNVSFKLLLILIL